MRQIPSLQQDEELAYMYSEMESNLIKMANWPGPTGTGP
jgi:hypothetical protein